MLALGRQQRLVVHAEEQTGPWIPSRSRGVQAAELHAHLWRRERRFGDQRALEVSLWYVGFRRRIAPTIETESTGLWSIQVSLRRNVAIETHMHLFLSEKPRCARVSFEMRLLYWISRAN